LGSGAGGHPSDPKEQTSPFGRTFLAQPHGYFIVLGKGISCHLVHPQKGLVNPTRNAALANREFVIPALEELE